MSAKAARLWRQAGLYMGASVASAALGFAGTALFTRLYAPADYGVYLSANALGGILSATLFTWVRLSVLRVESRRGSSDVRSTALACYAAAAALLALAAPLLRFGAGLPWPVSGGACLFAGTVALFELQLEILRARQRVRAYAAGAAARAALTLALGWGIARLDLGGFGLSLSIGLAYAAVSLSVAPAVWAAPVARFDPAAARAMLRFGLPATLGALTMALHGAADRLFAVKVLGEAAGGQYGVAADFTRQLVLVPTVALGSALVPAAIARHAAEGVEGARRHLAAGGEMLLGLLLPLVVGLALAGPDLAGLVLGERFRAAAAVLIPVLSFVWLFQGLTQNYVHAGFHIAGRSGGMLVGAAASLAVDVLLIVPAMLRFGVLGAAGTALLAEAVGTAVSFALARRHFPLPLDLAGLGRVAAATAAMAAAVWGVGSVLRPAASPAVTLAALVSAGALSYGMAASALDVAGLGTLLRSRARCRPAPHPGGRTP